MNTLYIALSFLFPILWIIGLTSTLIYIFKKRFNFQQLLPVALMSSVLLVYFVTMLLHHITVGIWLTIIFAASSIPLFILDKSRTKTLFENILTPGLVVFILLYILLYIIDFNKVILLLSDSSMHWAPHVWTMWLRDDFYTSPGLSIVNHGDYTPALQLFELIWMKLTGVWREGFLYLALEVISFSLLFPTIGKLTWKNKKTHVWSIIFLFLITIATLPLLLPVSYFYNTIEVDTALALLFTYGVYLAVTESKKVSKYSLIKIGILLTFLSLTKQIALIFGGIIIVIFIGNVWLNTKLRIVEIIRRLTQYAKNYRQNWQGITLALVLLVLPIMSLKLWSLQTAGYESPDKGIAIFHLGLDEIKQIPDIISGHAGNESQQAYPKNLAKYLVQNPVGFLVNFFGSVSYLQFFLIASAVAIFTGFRYKDKLSRYKLYFTSTVLLAGWGAYLLTVMATFLVGGMKDVERDNMVMNDRYLRTYIFALLAMLVMWFVGMVMAKINTRIVVGWTVGMLLLFGLLINTSNLDPFKIHAPTVYLNNSISTPYDYIDLRELQDDGGTFANPEKILITEETRDPAFHYLQYSALPNRVTVLTDKFLSNEDLCKTLQRYDYLVIDHIINKTQKINNCLVSPLKIGEDQVYKILTPNNSNSIKLLPYNGK